MITNSRERDVETKQEGNKNDGKSPKAPSSSRQLLGFRNPRIVRVSRAFGGKDRHSKVCTIRGLRDRRIRLSVPTAIQLYDLQDRLGLSQPSKVIDWLLDATKLDIDDLPPLQIPQGFGQFHQETVVSQESSASQSSFPPFFDANFTFFKGEGADGGINISNSVEGEDNQTLIERSRYWDLDATSRGKSQVERENIGEKIKWLKTNEQENQQGISGFNKSQVSPQNFFPSFPGLPNNSMPYNFYYNWEPSNVYLSHFGSHGFSSQSENPNSTKNMHLLPSNPTSLLPSTHPISFPVKFSPSSVNPGLLHLHKTNEQQSDEDGTGS